MVFSDKIVLMSGMRKVLIIEDEEELLEVLKDNLDSLGIEVVTAGDGEIAMNLIRDHDFYAVLSDITMPKKNGLKLLEEIRSEQPELPFVFLTGNATQEGILEALRLRAMDVMFKPFKGKDLCATVAKAVEVGAKQKEIDQKLNELSGQGAESKKIADSIRSKRKQITILQINKNK